MSAKNRECPNLNLVKKQFAEGKVDRREFLRISTLLGMSAAAAYTFADKISPGASAQTAVPAGSFPKGGTVRLHNRLDKLPDPHVYNSPMHSNIGRPFLEYLTETGYDNVTRPYLAEKWEVSPDLKTWTFKLRKDVKWHSGRAFTTDDVIWNLKRALDPATGSSQLGLMKGYLLQEYETGEKDSNGNVKKSTRLWDANALEKVDDFTLRMNLKAPQFAVPEHLYHHSMPISDPMKPGAIEVGSDGTGAFEMVEFQPRGKAVYKARKVHWGGGAYLDTFELVDLGDDSSAQIGALASKQVDGLVEGQVVQYEVLSKMSHLQEHSVQTSLTACARGKVDRKPFSDARVRLAMRLAVDADKATALSRRSLGSPAEHHHVSPVVPDYAKLKPFKRNVAKAKELLAAAGYPNGLDIDSPFMAPKDVEWISSLAQALVEQWKEAGIRVKLEIMPGAQFWENWDKWPFAIIRWSHRPLGVMAISLAYRSGAAWNDSGYSNAKFDEVLNNAEGIVDVNERRKLMAVMEKILQDDGPSVQPTWASIFTFMDKRVRGFQMHPSIYLSPQRLAVVS